MAISNPTSIWSLSAIKTAVLCSAALPIIGIKIIPTKNSLQPKVSVIDSIPFTRNSLSIAINTVAILNINMDFFKLHFADVYKRQVHNPMQ